MLLKSEVYFINKPLQPPTLFEKKNNNNQEQTKYLLQINKKLFLT